MKTPLKKSSLGVIASPSTSLRVNSAKQSNGIAAAPSGPRNDFFRGFMKRIAASIFFLFFFTLTLNALAKGSSHILEEFQSLFKPAEVHRGLENPYEALDLAKVKSYAVVLKGGIPAERGAFYIGWEDYDYRGATIEGDEIKTRRGSIYTFLKPGDVMAVADVDHLGRTLYFKLISPDVYVPESRQQEKRHSRVTVLVGIKLPKDVAKEDNVQKALEIVFEWFKPFADINDAKAFGGELAKQVRASTEKPSDVPAPAENTEEKNVKVKRQYQEKGAPQRRDKM